MAPNGQQVGTLCFDHACQRYSLLIALLVLATNQTVVSFDLIKLLAEPLPHSAQTLFFILCLIGFGVKVPLVPVHTWLPQFSACTGFNHALLVGFKGRRLWFDCFALPLAPDGAFIGYWLV